MQQLRRIVLVCSGNTCRSVMAEAMLRHELEKIMGDQARDITVTSAGVYAFPGDPASRHAEEAMRELGLDVSLHRAGRVSREALDGADLVLAMTAAIKDELQRAYPALSSKMQTLTEFSGLVDEFGYDIKDPFGGSLEIYRESARQIGMAVEEVARKIKESFELRGDTDEDRDRK